MNPPPAPSDMPIQVVALGSLALSAGLLAKQFKYKRPWLYSAPFLLWSAILTVDEIEYQDRMQEYAKEFREKGGLFSPPEVPQSGLNRVVRALTPRKFRRRRE